MTGDTELKAFHWFICSVSVSVIWNWICTWVRIEYSVTILDPLLFQSSPKGFQLSSSLLQLLLPHPFPYCGLLVAIKWNLMLFLNRIALLRAEKLHRAVRWGPSWTSQNVLHLSSQEECSQTCMRGSTASRVGCWKETVPHKRGGWKLYPCHTEYGANAWEERGWAAGELLKSWTKISITNKL